MKSFQQHPVNVGYPQPNSGTRTGTRGDDLSEFGYPNGYPQKVLHRAKRPADPAIESGWKSRRERQQKHLRLDAETLRAVEDWCRVNRVMVQDLIDHLLSMFMRSCAATAQGLRFDDLIDRMIDDQISGAQSVENSPAQATEKPSTGKMQNDLLRLYADLSGNRIRQADRVALRAASDLPEAVIYAGILRARVRCAGRIGSFAYCLKVARQVADQGDVDAELRHLREKLLLQKQDGQLVLPMNTERLIFGDFQAAEK